ncbi:MAG: hypothetical protein F6K26_03820 [Moorea sp. SIO2I5]|nr:hypothetical protein [Moorena sp. SIO2I5]
MTTLIENKNSAILTAQQIFSNPDEYVIFDLETTGLGDTAQITEIGILSLKNEVLAHYYIAPEGNDPVLRANGACTFPEAYEHLAETLKGKTVIVYNIGFDRSILNNTTKQHHLSPLVNDKAICAMMLKKKWLIAETVEPLNGPHDAIGDCRATLTLLKEIASTGMEVDDDNLPIVTEDDFKALVARFQDIAAQRLALDKIEKRLKAKAVEYMVQQDSEEIPLNLTHKVKRVTGISAKITSSLTYEDIPDKYLSFRLDNKAIKTDLSTNALPEGLFEITPTSNIRVVKL